MTLTRKMLTAGSYHLIDDKGVVIATANELVGGWVWALFPDLVFGRNWPIAGVEPTLTACIMTLEEYIDEYGVGPRV